MAESGGDTAVVNSIGCVGLWQINQPVHVKSHPTWTVRWLQDPFNNARAAKAIHASQGWGAWEAYTGPDGKGTDGPWRDHQATSTAVSAGWWEDFKRGFDFGPGPEDLFDGGTENDPGLSDALTGGLSESLKKTADVLVNPRTWLRISYGAVGIVLITGGLFLMARGTVVASAVKPLTKSISRVGSK